MSAAGGGGRAGRPLLRRLLPALAAGIAAAPAPAATLDEVRAAGMLACGVSQGLAGFAYAGDDGRWTGFDAAYCRALAAAVLGDPERVRFVPTSTKSRFAQLRSGEVDVLARNTTWTFSRDVTLGLTFAGVNFYDGQGFLGRRALGLASAGELGGASVCIQLGTTTELNLANFFRRRGMDYEPVPIETNAEAQLAYQGGRCDVLASDASGLAAVRSALADPDAHMIFPEIISKEPLGPLVREGDEQWADIARWVLNALILGEEHGLTQANVAARAAAGSDLTVVNRLLGREGGAGADLGLDAEWAVRALAAEGNYAEIFERYVGAGSKLGLARGLNALYRDGGLLYAPPFL